MLVKKIILLLLLSSLLFSETLFIDSKKFIFKDFKMAKFVDKTNTLSIDEVQKREFNTVVDNAYSNGFVAQKSIWHKFSIKNELNKDVEFVFNDALYHLPSEYDLYIVNNNSKIIYSYFGGFDRGDDKQTIIDHQPSFFRLKLEAGDTYTFYIKSYFKQGNSSIYNFSIYDVDSHIDAMIYENILLTFLLGGMLTLLLYNLLIYLYTKDRVYIYYVAYLFFSFIIGFVFMSGFVYKFFNITNNSWIHYGTYATPLTLIFILMFTSRIFDTKKYYLKINKFLTASIYFVAIYVVLSALFGLLNLLPIIMLFALIMGFAIVLIGIYMTYKRNRLGVIYLVSTASYASFAIITILYYLGNLPTNVFTSNSLMIGSLIEGFGLSLLLAYRINLLKKQNSSLTLLSATDALTNLYNRRHFEERIPVEINRAKRDNKIFAFTLLDIDNFKKYNDTYGHQDGDKVLKDVAKALQDSFKRSHDIIFRLGGEEFGVIYSAKSVEEINFLVDKARKKIESLEIEHKLNLPKKVVTASFGLGILCLKECNADTDVNKLYKSVDELLYKAKDSGRNMVCSKVLS